MSDYKAIGYTDWEWIVARAGELYDRQRKSKRGVSGQGIFREDGHEYWYAVAAQERIAAALNQRSELATQPQAEPVAVIHNDGYWTHEPGKDPFDRFGPNKNKGSLEVFSAPQPQAVNGYTDDDRARIVSAMQSMRDRLGGFLTAKYGDQFDGDLDTMLDAINWMKAVRHYKDHVPLICAKHPATLALPARKSPPAPHTDDEECNCVQVAYADGWNNCRAAMLAANKENGNG